jgi:hypothetical protein
MIRLVSVIGHGKELIPHFIKHYSNYVDEIQFVIYETDLYNNLTNEVSELIKGNDKVKIVKTIKDRIFDWEKVTQLYNFIKSKSPNDWWVIADIDEFHLYPNDDLKKLIQNCNEYGWDVVRGGFIDRIGIDGEFPELVEEVSIWEQFPNAGFFRYPMSQACPNKICVVKGNVEITSGQHYAKIDGQTTWKWQGWNHPLINPHSFVQVHHFKWDKTCVDRIKSVADLKQTYSYSNEYSVMYEGLRKNKFKINLDKTEFMFELGLIYPNFDRYTKWNKLIKKIISI